MKRVDELYLSYVTEDKYTDLNEKKILTSIYDIKIGSFQSIISKAINDAVLNHMNLAIDSTIMQVLALNKYLSRLFINNFDILIHNYIIHYLEQKAICEVTDDQYGKIEELVLQTDMEDELEIFIDNIESICSVKNELP